VNFGGDEIGSTSVIKAKILLSMIPLQRVININANDNYAFGDLKMAA